MDVFAILITICLAAMPFAARYRGGIRWLVPVAVLLGGILASNEIWHWLTPPTFYGVAPWAWWATVGIITVVYLPPAPRPSLRVLQFIGALLVAVFVPGFGFWIS